MKSAIVFGAGGFIGNHLVTRLKQNGYYVRAVDLKFPEYAASMADEFIIGDLRLKETVEKAVSENTDELYQLASDVGGAGYIFSGEHDADVMYNSALINLYTAKVCAAQKVKKIFYSSSACMYPEYNQVSEDSPKLAEDTAYPAAPDSEYGWEKLFSERVYLSFKRNYKLNIKIARFHNIYGPECAWNNGKEKAPAALCRKVIQAKSADNIEIWGDGKQTRSFLYIEDCLDAVQLLMQHETFFGPVNIGSEEMITINDFAKMIIALSGKTLSIKNILGPTGVRGRSSDNKLIAENLNWKPKYDLQQGIEKTYEWIKSVQ